MIRLERPYRTLSGGGSFSELFRVALFFVFSRFPNIDFSGPRGREARNFGRGVSDLPPFCARRLSETHDSTKLTKTQTKRQVSF